MKEMRQLQLCIRVYCNGSIPRSGLAATVYIMPDADDHASCRRQLTMGCVLKLCGWNVHDLS